MIYNWSKNTYTKKKIFFPKDINELLNKVKNTKHSFGICGNLRSYGDTCINNKNLLSLKKIKKVIEINKVKNILCVSANVLLIEILEKIIPEGYMINVTPGTKYATVGGMIANNIIGKNSSLNQFKYHIQEIEILTSTNKIIKCSEFKNKKLFNLTVGGFGLTGIILNAKIRLRKIKNQYINQKIVKFNDLNNFLKHNNKKKRFSVSWIDSHSLSDNKFKGLIYFGDYNNKINKNEKFNYKNIRMNIFSKLILKTYIKNYYFSKFINSLFFLFKPKYKTINFDNFFYPQDKWLDWNKCYNNGLIQIQFLIVENKLSEVLNQISIFFRKNLIKSTFIILKKVNESGAYLNFNGKGYSLSFDFEKNQDYLKIKYFFNDLFYKFNANIYLSKDIIINDSLLKNKNQYKTFKKDLRYIDNRKLFINNFSKRLKLK